MEDGKDVFQNPSHLFPPSMPAWPKRPSQRTKWQRPPVKRTYRDLAYFLPSKWHLQSQIAMTPMSLWPAGGAKPQKKTVAMHVTSTGIAISVQWCILHWVHLCTRKDSPLQLEHPKCRHLDVFDMI